MSATSPHSNWKTPSALIALSVIPLMGGAVRLSGLARGAAITADNERFMVSPTPVALHVICAAVFCIFGALQFSDSFHRRLPSWHRVSGRILVPCGMVVALSGIWMTLFYRIGVPLQGELLFSTRLIVGVAMAISMAIAVAAIWQRDFAKHRAWMIRSYALAQGAGTQVLLLLPLILVSGEALGFKRDLLMTFAWLINIAIAEWIIRRQFTKTLLLKVL